MFLTRLACITGALGVASALPPDSTYSTPAAPHIHLDYATYQGTHLPGDGVDQFLGMRFAKPALGDLRWRAPQEPERQDQIQDATNFGNLCVGDSVGPDARHGEDCLFVNVFKPSNATNTSKLPVWVFIQGGGYARNDNGNFNGSEIIHSSGGKVVFVNFNYRTGVLGFLASEKVRQDGALNAGLLDQRMLLKWVQKYICQFGGDPNHVVIHGDSAGAGSVSYHLTAYGGNDKENLFIAGIPESPFWPTQRTVAQNEFQYTRLLNRTGCGSLDCLRKVDVRVLGNVSLPSAFPEARDGDPAPLWYWLPVVDGNLVQDHMYSQFMTGRFKRVPMLVGDDTNEGSYFGANAKSDAEVQAFLRANYPRLQQWQLDIVSTLYPKMDPLPQHEAYFPSASAAYGDCTFTCAGNTMADAVSWFVGREKSWNYHYNTADPKQVAQGLGVPHVAEIGAIFGPDNVQGQEAKSLRNINAAIVPVVRAYFTSFVRFLDPNTDRDPGSPMWENWGTFAGAGQRMRLQTNNSAMETVPFDLVEKCELWKFLAKSMDL